MQAKVKRIHFVGIGGIGMSGIAELLRERGYTVSGSDLREGKSVERLRSLGVEVRTGHDAEAVGDADVVVRSSAIRPTNPELLRAAREGIPVVSRGEMLAELMRRRDGIAVGGSHGKTTTSSLVAHLLTAGGRDPSVVVGGRVRAADGEPRNAWLGRGDWLVAEADESDGSFLLLPACIAVVTTIDAEHLDHYGDFDAVKDAFVAFANRVPFWGAAVLGVDDPGVQSILPRVTRRHVGFGLGEAAEWRACELEAEGLGTVFSVLRHGERLGRARVPLPGVHNVANALAALAVAAELDLPFAGCAEALDAFVGVERRFQMLGEAAGVTVVDDYGHHPGELRATLLAARAAHAGRIVAVFQPHRFTRTRDCWDEFTRAFEQADCARICSVYTAGEDPIPGVDGEDLAAAVTAAGHADARYCGSLDDACAALAEELRPGDLVLTLGAGDITQLGPRLLEARARGAST